eukprot:633273-Amphidinium_carterae.1
MAHATTILAAAKATSYKNGKNLHTHIIDKPQNIKDIRVVPIVKRKFPGQSLIYVSSAFIGYRAGGLTELAVHALLILQAPPRPSQRGSRLAR